MSNHDRSLVKNAAAKNQVKKARNKEERLREEELGDLKALLKSKEGRRIVWRMLAKCRVFESIWEGSARIHFNAGQQDLGHWLLAEVTEADDEALLIMMRENKNKED